jgi:hypothetical protein
MGAPGLLGDVLGLAGQLALDLITIVGFGIGVSGDTTLHAAPRTTPQDLVDAGWHYHHWFPQEFDDQFNELGIDVDRYTTLIPPDLHIPIHQDGWNEAWHDWLDDAERYGYTPNDAVAYLYELLQPYLQQLEDIGVIGPNGLKAIVPYPRP